GCAAGGRGAPCAGDRSRRRRTPTAALAPPRSPHPRPRGRTRSSEPGPSRDAGPCRAGSRPHRRGLLCSSAAPPSPADRAHGADRLRATSLVELVTCEFAPHRGPPGVRDLLVVGSVSKQGTKVGLGRAEQARAYGAVGGQAGAFAGLAEGTGDRGDDAHLLRSTVHQPPFGRGAATLGGAGSEC